MPGIAITDRGNMSGIMEFVEYVDSINKERQETGNKGKYTFNKAHAVCYTWLGFQMAYLKANYPNEFNQIMEKNIH